jgi:hypothetical protein
VGVRLYLLLLVFLGGNAAAAERPLPDKDAFLREVRKNLRSDRLLLSQYTYTETQTELKLDRNGKTVGTEVTVSEIYPSLDEELSYRRLVRKNGKDVSAKDLSESDRRHDEKLSKRQRQLEREGTDERRKRLAEEAGERRKEDEAIEEMFRLYRIAIVGRSVRDGRDAIELTFTPDRSYKPKTREAKTMSKVAGRAWFCEEDFQLMRVEADLLEDFKLGLGLLAKLNKGARMTFDRRKVNDEAWLPFSARFTGVGRLMVFKGLRLDVTSEYSEHRKFTVQTSVTYKGEKESR